MKDKILFWLDDDLAYFCMSYYLQKMHDAEFYAIVDITNKPKKFFQEQKLVPFKKVWYFHDHIKSDKKPDLEYLSSFEKKYNIDLWKLAINERIFYRFFDFHKFTSDEILSIDEHACKLFESVLDEVKPDFIVTKEPAFHHLEIFYELCRARGIKVLMLSIPKVGFRCMISEEPQKISTNKTLQDVQGKNRSIEELREYLKSHSPAAQIKSYDVGKKFLNEIYSIKEFDNKNIKTNYNYYGRTKRKVFFDTLKSILKEKFRRRFINSNLVTKVDYDSKFVYFPLGVDNGKEILIAAPFYTNQIDVIKHVTKSLPVGYKLYVKEHPSSIIHDWRSTSEYKEIMNIPNVTLIHPAVNSEKLYRNCSLVVSISGSAGLEAAFYQVTSIVFSNPDYTMLPSVFQIKDIEDLPKKIRYALDIDPDVKNLDKYLTLIEENTFDFDWFGLLIDIRTHFYSKKIPFDTNIAEKNMELFLKDNKKKLISLSTEFLKRIN